MTATASSVASASIAMRLSAYCAATRPSGDSLSPAVAAFAAAAGTSSAIVSARRSGRCEFADR